MICRHRYTEFIPLLVSYRVVRPWTHTHATIQCTYFAIYVKALWLFLQPCALTSRGRARASSIWYSNSTHTHTHRDRHIHRNAIRWNVPALESTRSATVCAQLMQFSIPQYGWITRAKARERPAIMCTDLIWLMIARVRAIDYNSEHIYIHNTHLLPHTNPVCGRSQTQRPNQCLGVSGSSGVFAFQSDTALLPNRQLANTFYGHDWWGWPSASSLEYIDMYYYPRDLSIFSCGPRSYKLYKMFSSKLNYKLRLLVL